MLFYTKLTKYYDKIYHYVDYKKQADFFVRYIKKLSTSKNNKVLDVCCGTGNHISFFQEAGFNVVGFDISSEMLKEAKKKSPSIRFIKGDMKKMFFDEKFGAIICFFNSILYNKNAKELKTTLKNFYSHLDKGGVLIFDTVDKTIGINSKKDKLEYEEKDVKIIFQPQWIYDEKKNVMDLEIDFIINNKKIHDHHTMGAFTNNEMKEMLKKTGFEIFMFKKKQFNPQGKAVIFVCKK